jgi:hypothetical protein
VRKLSHDAVFSLSAGTNNNKVLNRLDQVLGPQELRRIRCTKLSQDCGDYPRAATVCVRAQDMSAT